MKKILIAYYSRRGLNYVNGSIVNLKEGNTEVIARKIVDQLEADVFQIDTVKSYPLDYMETTEVSKQELRANVRPELTAKVEQMDDYDVIILGYPNWWGTMPMAVFHFLEQYDFAGKTIVPYCTHEGSKMGHSVADIKKLCPDANVTMGVAIHGASSAYANKEVELIIELANQSNI